MKILFAFLFCLFSFSVSYSQDENFMLENLGADFKEVSVVVHVDNKSYEVADDIGGYKLYKISAEAKETFKGKLKRGQAFDFYVVADSDYPAKNFLGEHVVFLNYDNSEKLKLKNALFQLENSTRPASQEVITALRKLKPKPKPRK